METKIVVNSDNHDCDYQVASLRRSGINGNFLLVQLAKYQLIGRFSSEKWN
ncbi:hypothetical protein [Nostoc sp.]|uniref:hypothetical protein n=1 Tax=Nostoc sp. TaxID=1180 RepID=UPI003FA53C67